MPPPRTLKPVEPSLGVCTPGIIWITRMMSASPISAGSLRMTSPLTVSMPSCGRVS